MGGVLSFWDDHTLTGRRVRSALFADEADGRNGFGKGQPKYQTDSRSIRRERCYRCSCAKPGCVNCACAARRCEWKCSSLGYYRRTKGGRVCGEESNSHRGGDRG